MNHKLLAMGLAFGMTMSLAACSGGSTSASSSTDASATGSTAGSSASSSSAAGSASASFTTVEEGKLIMATNAQFPPYEMVADGDGVYQGFEGIDVELAVAIADKLGLELVIDDMDFDSALLAVQNNAADLVLAGLSYSEDRDAAMDFTEKYATGVQVVIVKEGSDVTLDNLGEKMIGTQRGTTGYKYASDTPENGVYGEDHVLGYDSGARAVQALVDGQVDAVIIDQAPAQEYVAANEGLTILPTEWVVEDYCIAVDDGNTALLDAVQGALSELQADGTVDNIIAKYIKAD